jgi:hypothetical protein
MTSNTASDEFRVLALVGVYAADFNDPRHKNSVRPVIAGVVTEDEWSHQTQQETDQAWNELRKTFDPSDMDYLWREAWLTLDAAAMRAHFAQPANPGEEPGTPDSMLSLLTLAGVHIGDYDHPSHHDTFIPVIAGVVDESVWGMETEEDTAARWATVTPSFDPSGSDYLWREIWVSVPVDTLRGLFDQPAITAADQPPPASRQGTDG